MADETRPDHDQESPQGLFKKYPKLGVLLIAGVFYLTLLVMCVIVAVLILRG